MSELNVVHVSPTPLVGAPGKIAWAQRLKGHNSLSLVFNDYPKSGSLAGVFLDKSVTLNKFTKEHIEHEIEQADIIHVHNFLAEENMNWLLKLNQCASYVYQVHSPLREGPLYVNRAPSVPDSISFAVKLVVGQYAGRMYPDFIPVPNIIAEPPNVKPRKSGEKLKLMFSPSHSRGGRWNAKYSEKCETVIDALSKIDKIHLVQPDKPAPPSVLMEVRRGCHISIDEISTGAFHQVSLEALCAGNISVNRADYFSKATFSNFCNGEMPPFVYADDSSIAGTLLDLADDWEETARLQQDSYNFFKDHCNPLNQIEAFDAAYQQI